MAHQLPRPIIAPSQQWCGRLLNCECPVRPFRRIRRSLAQPRRAGPGRVARRHDGAAGHRRAGGPNRHLADGRAGLAGADPAARGRRLRAHRAGRAPAGRGRRPHLPHQRRHRGTAAGTCCRSTGSPSGHGASGSATRSAISAMRRCATTPGSARGGPPRSTRCCRRTTSGRPASSPDHDGDDAELAAATWDLDRARRVVPAAGCADAAALVERSRRRRRRPGGVRDPQPTRARVAQVPVPRPRTAPRAAARPVAGRRGRGVLRRPGASGCYPLPVAMLMRACEHPPQRTEEPDERRRVHRRGRRRDHHLARPDQMNSLDLATKEALLGRGPQRRRRRGRAMRGDHRQRARLLRRAGPARAHRADLDQVDGGGLVDRRRPLRPDRHDHRRDAQARDRGRQRRRGGRRACRSRWPATSGSRRMQAGFNTAFTGVALSCDTGSSWTLPRLVGPTKAMELLLMPRTVKADEALALGLVELRRRGRRAGRDRRRARRRTWPPGRRSPMPQSRHRWHTRQRHSLSDALAFESQMMARTGASADHRNAVQSFVAKEKPTFEGQ